MHAGEEKLCVVMFKNESLDPLHQDNHIRISDIAFHPLRISRFDLVKVVLYPRMTFYTSLIFDEILLVNCTHYNIYLTRSGLYPHHQCVT